MELGKVLKSKKILLGVGLVAVILVGFFALKFMTSGTEDQAEKERPRTTHKTTQRIPKTAKQDEPETSPLFKAMEALKDPFRAEDPKAAELKDKLDLAKKEVEYLKAILEEKKLKQEIKEIEKSLTQDQDADRSGSEVAILPPGETQTESKSKTGLLVKAILITDESRSALLVFGDRRTWVHEGEHFDGWEISQIREESVVVLKKGKKYVFFYDRPAIGFEGES
jgi:flagellar basal body-associated protein FliL